MEGETDKKRLREKREWGSKGQKMSQRVMDREKETERKGVI